LPRAAEASRSSASRRRRAANAPKSVSLPDGSARSLAVGRYDWVCPPVASRILAAGIPDAELVEFPQSGHFPFAEEPAAFHATAGLR
jgi:pimeloyl-ACP methyl ester carboxylesterase